MLDEVRKRRKSECYFSDGLKKITTNNGGRMRAEGGGFFFFQNKLIVKLDVNSLTRVVRWKQNRNGFKACKRLQAFEIID